MKCFFFFSVCEIKNNSSGNSLKIVGAFYVLIAFYTKPFLPLDPPFSTFKSERKFYTIFRSQGLFDGQWEECPLYSDGQNATLQRSLLPCWRLCQVALDTEICRHCQMGGQLSMAQDTPSNL